MSLDLRYRLIDLARGTDSIGLLKELRCWQFESPQSLARREAASMRSYFDQLRQTVPQFAAVERFEDLPVIDKHYINQHHASLMNAAYPGRRVRKKTGGSTGEPLVYFTGVEAQSYLWAGLFLAWEVAGYRLGEPVAFLAGSSLFGTGIKQKVYYGLLNVTLMSAFDMSRAQLDAYGEALDRGGIRLLYGYASAIHQLALHWRALGRKPKNRLRAVVCTAELLTLQMRADIEEVLGAPCFSQYGCNDAGVSAFECEHRKGFHLISTRCHAEVLEDGRLIATDLANTAMFMPRYDTGDRVRLSDRMCACGRGFPLIDEVLGRQNDVVLDPAGGSVHSEFFTHLFREDQRIQSFQVLFDERSLRVNLHSSADAAEQALMAERYSGCIQQSLRFPIFELVFNQPYARLANAKHRFVMRAPRA
ncbi:phenylacetate-CoA ligase [Inhella inkyongensis]|uniref:Phenylacetate-CoA ligase n=1 Tax=Inhella inkyongensis TaxID=392593 RepID=A0A840S6Z6_9BURK|nr:phenylacetate--CoA ligase family protein [Inhella inkyongensis]MBB5204351.1 phenylacetate-CoA ligase [Inhella inkyongensis]